MCVNCTHNAIVSYFSWDSLFISFLRTETYVLNPIKRQYGNKKTCGSKTLHLLLFSGVYDGLSLPPTPPSSASSDSEGGMSPQRSAPSSPIRHLHHTHRHNPLRSTHHIHSAAAASLFSSPVSSNN